MTRFISLLISLSLSLSSFAYAQDSWHVKKLSFLALAQGNKIEGEFKKTRDSIFLNFDNLSSSAVEVRIIIDSLSVKKVTDRELLLGPDFFDTKNHKHARFVSSSLEKISNNKFIANGFLTIRGISRTIILPFTRENQNTIVGHTTIDRRWFGIGRGSWESKGKISHPVQIRFSLSQKQ